MNLPIIVTIPSNKKGRKKLFAMIGVIALLLACAIAFYATNQHKQINSIDTVLSINDYAPEQVSQGMIYSFDRPIIFGKYLEYTGDDSSSDVDYYLFSYEHDNNNYISALIVPSSSDIKEKIASLDYTNETMSFCAESVNAKTLSDEIYSRYIEYADELAISSEGFSTADLVFAYRFEEARMLDEYKKNEIGNYKVGLFLAAVFAVAGVLCLLIGLIRRK